MNSVEATSNGLYYAATQAALQKAASDAALKNEKTDSPQKAQKPLFSSLLKKNLNQNSVEEAGLPLEIAEMPEEKALVFLKDQLDLAGDELSRYASGESFEKYKKAVGQFVTYIQKKNYAVHEQKLPGFRRGKRREPLILIKTINEKLDRLAYDIWYNHLDKLRLLEKVKEINGLVVDLTG